VQHSPEHNQVNITVSRSNSERCIIQISDCGAGIPHEDLKSIFNPFFRSNANNVSKGYGLGLAITQRVMQAHSGFVTAENRLNGGLLVTIILPINFNNA
jgi:signal transduction histidine kinase